MLYRYWIFNLLVPTLTAALLIFFYITLHECWKIGRNGRANWLRALLTALFFGYLVGLFSITLDIEILLREGFHLDPDYNLQPFKQIWGFLNYMESSHTNVNLWGNIVVFLPIGYMIPLLWPQRRPVLSGALWGMGISLFIELFQIVTPRVTDIDDIILNTLGGLLGALLYRLTRRFFRSAATQLHSNAGQGKKP